MSRLDRMLGILLLLGQGRIWSASRLAARFEVSVRTIHRDVVQLGAVGVPVYAERGAGGGFRLLPGYTVHPVNFTRNEAVSLVLGMSFLKSLRAAPYQRDLETAEVKLLAVLPGEVRSALAHTDRLFAFEGPAVDILHPEEPGAGGQGESLALDVFLGAILDRRMVRIVYRSADHKAAEELDVIPAALLWDRGHWYLVGRPTAAAQARLFRADHTEWAATGDSSPASTGLDARNMLGRTWLNRVLRDWSAETPVRIEMSAAQARRIREDWYFGHALFEPAGEDRIVMTYGERDHGRAFELVRWLGSEAELLAPADWRPLFAQELHAMQCRYAITSKT